MVGMALWGFYVESLEHFSWIMRNKRALFSNCIYVPLSMVLVLVILEIFEELMTSSVRWQHPRSTPFSCFEVGQMSIKQRRRQGKFIIYIILFWLRYLGLQYYVLMVASLRGLLRFDRICACRGATQAMYEY